MLLVRLRSTGNWILFDRGMMWIYSEMTSGKCLRITLGFVPARVSLRSLLKRFTHTFYVKVDSNPGDGSLHAWKSGDSTSLLHLAALVRCLRCLRRTLFCSTVIRFMRQSLWQSLVLCLVCLRSTRLRLDRGYSAFVSLLHCDLGF